MSNLLNTLLGYDPPISNRKVKMAREIMGHYSCSEDSAAKAVSVLEDMFGEVEVISCQPLSNSVFDKMLRSGGCHTDINGFIYTVDSEGNEIQLGYAGEEK